MPAGLFRLVEISLIRKAPKLSKYDLQQVGDRHKATCAWKNGRQNAETTRASLCVEASAHSVHQLPF